MGKTAIILGATGLTGSILLEKGLRSCVLLPIGYRDPENDWLANLKKVRKSTADLVTVVE
jgi:nitroreductase